MKRNEREDIMTKEEARERIIADHMKKAQGDGRRADVQAARRCLEKRGIG
jgi:hypothetical protein